MKEVKYLEYLVSEVAFKDYRCVIGTTIEYSLYFWKKKESIESDNNKLSELSQISYYNVFFLTFFAKC
ncbi:MAG: hypothetical protein KAW66_04240 [Candidatus Lokiarchaeota archaeon]|nr:hypothetical protein [Candidatus Lokiarchaeota archaeon]